MGGGSTVKRIFITVIVVIISVSLIGFMREINRSDEIELGPLSLGKLLPAANSTAEKWADDSFLISAVGMEVRWDRNAYGTIDTKMLDGKCSLWRFTYFSPDMVDYFTFYFKNRRGGSWGENTYSCKDGDLDLLRPLTKFMDSDELSLDHKIEDLEGEDAERMNEAFFYWLHYDKNGDALWTIYRNNESGIDWSVEVDARNGETVSDPAIDKGMSFLEALELIDELDVAPGGEYDLLMALGNERSYFHQPFPSYYRSLRIPDAKRGDGCVDWWTIVWISKVDRHSYMIRIWTDGSYIAQNGSEWPDHENYITDVHPSTLTDSTDAMDILKNEYSYLSHDRYYNYEIHFHYSNGDFDSPMWRIDSPSGCYTIVYRIDAYNGTILDRY